MYEESETHIEASKELGSVFKQGHDIIRLVFGFLKIKI